MIPFADDVNRVRDYLVSKHSPERIVLFGSVAKGRAREESDLDICVVMQVEDKRTKAMEMQLDLVNLIDRDVDIILLTPSQWERYRHDPSKLTHHIEQTGVLLYG